MPLSLDPTPFIAASWLLSALTIGGLCLHAVLEAQGDKE
ncbi:hypothetical protein PB2503_06667 [Parvularcula bermudensis HTCC2503]|uniref:Uncharacterized protein n=1 Tax=Parvularcula bermudensis (strain ATCC BAA-594 / HTCC2503 / KCTC 12087) TaxID=314260 RepID=E0TI60_PARBH|nr:hypothetical protein PB2503_06667 [Parvularcula bermudensis HTCC2503]